MPQINLTNLNNKWYIASPRNYDVELLTAGTFIDRDIVIGAYTYGEDEAIDILGTSSTGTSASGTLVSTVTPTDSDQYINVTSGYTDAKYWKIGATVTAAADITEGDAVLTPTNVTLSDTNNEISIVGSGTSSITSGVITAQDIPLNSTTKYISALTIPSTKTFNGVTVTAGSSSGTYTTLYADINNYTRTYITNSANSSSMGASYVYLKSTVGQLEINKRAMYAYVNASSSTSSYIDYLYIGNESTSSYTTRGYVTNLTLYGKNSNTSYYDYINKLNVGTSTSYTNARINTINNYGTISTINNYGTISTITSGSSSLGTLSINAYDNASSTALTGTQSVISGGKWVETICYTSTADGYNYGRVYHYGTTTSNIAAANIKHGVTITVGDSASSTRIANETGTFYNDGTTYTLSSVGTKIDMGASSSHRYITTSGLQVIPTTPYEASGAVSNIDITGYGTLTIASTSGTKSGGTVSWGSGWITSGSETVTASDLGLTSDGAATTITPGTTDQTITANHYRTGTTTISGDADLVAGNIKSGVSIFGVTGTYSGGTDPHTAYTPNSTYFQTSTTGAVTAAKITSGGYTSSDYYVKSGSATTPTASGASTSTSLSGTTLTVARSVTPSVSAGWVSSGTAGTVTITGTVPTQTKSVTPSATSQTISPDSGNLLSSVTVNGDADLIASNIKHGVDIFGVTGTYVGDTIGWGAIETGTSSNPTLVTTAGYSDVEYISSVTVGNSETSQTFSVNDGVYTWTWTVDASGNVTIS